MIARKIRDVLETFTESFEHYLRQGKTEPSCHLILQLGQREGFSPSALAQAAAQCLDHLLDEFVVEPVIRFVAEMDSLVPGDIAEPIRQKVGQRLSVIQDWSGKIILISRERQARDLRAAVRGRQLLEAEQCVKAILAPPQGVSEPARPLVEFVGSILGSILHGQREVDQLIARLRSSGRSWGLNDELIGLMDGARQRRQRGPGSAPSEFHEAEFVRDLNVLTVELKGWLPNPRVAGQPTEEHITRFYQALHAIVASVFLGGDLSRWTDVTAVLVEYCPRELSVIGRRSGVEERAYMTLTPTARRVVFEAYGRIGRHATVAQSYLEFARSVEDERLARYVVEVMGAMRSGRFLPWLSKIFDSASSSAVRGDVLVAVSNFADGDSAEFVLRALGASVRRGLRRGQIPEGAERREVVEAIFALGRIVRSPRMDPGGRNVILKRAIALLPEKDSRLLFELAYQGFCTPSEGWDGALRDWAAATLTQGLWLGDMTPDFAPGDDRQSSIIGPRAPTVQALAAIGREGMPAILRTCKDSGLRYGLAYVALAEALGQIGDPSALDVLEHMLANALLQDTSERTKYQVEKYYDATEGVRKELTPDQVTAALLFAIERIGGERSDAILVRAYEQIRGPGATTLGPETDQLLDRVRARLVRDGRWNELLRQVGERHAERPEVRDEAAERREAAHAIKMLQAKFFLTGGRRIRKIGAIQTLARLRNLEAVPLIIQHLEDTDALVRASAETALGEYAWAAGNETVMRALVYALLDGLHSRNDAVRESIRTVLKRLGPGREPLRSKLQAASQHGTDALLRAEASRLLREGIEADTLDTLGTPGEQDQAGPKEAPEASQPSPSSARKRDLESMLRQKREYLLARQAWIRGGKRGEPPKPPPNGEGD